MSKIRKNNKKSKKYISIQIKIKQKNCKNLKKLKNKQKTFFKILQKYKI